jgi:ADP-ribose pyrophosphatase YjhB (NUDIX family)
MIKEPLSQKEFTEIFHKVPRLTVEVIVLSPKGILLTKRQIEPCKGMWHIPGGTVRFGEHLTDAVHRKALDELSSDVIVDKFLGYIEYPSHYDEGLDSPVGMAFRTALPGKEQDFELQSDMQWFTHLPDNIHEEQKQFLLEHGLKKE